MYEPLKLVENEKRDDERTWFAVDPDIAYPATIKRIQEAIAEGKIPQELVENFAAEEIDPRGVARRYLGEVNAMPSDGWALAVRPRESVQRSSDLALRARALEWVRLWLTQALHVAVDGGPMGIHILRREAWKI